MEAVKHKYLTPRLYCGSRLVYALDKFQEMALLLDTYGELLTDKQRDVMDQYYNYDLSLQEIAKMQESANRVFMI